MKQSAGAIRECDIGICDLFCIKHHRGASQITGPWHLIASTECNKRNIVKLYTALYEKKLDIIDKNNYFWSCKDVMELFLLNADPDRSHQQLSIPVRIKRPNSQPQTEVER